MPDMPNQSMPTINTKQFILLQNTKGLQFGVTHSRLNFSPVKENVWNSIKQNTNDGYIYIHIMSGSKPGTHLGVVLDCSQAVKSWECNTELQASLSNSLMHPSVSLAVIQLCDRSIRIRSHPLEISCYFLIIKSYLTTSYFLSNSFSLWLIS